MKIFYNHVGYEQNMPKEAVMESNKDLSDIEIELIQQDTGHKVYSGTLKRLGRVDGWHMSVFWIFNFSEVKNPGIYMIKINYNDRTVVSDSFTIGSRLLISKTASSVLAYFKIMRCSGRFDKTDMNTPFFGDRKDTRDLHGGWYDASGDTSKYLSHLSYTNYMNPQQIPLVVWNMLESFDLLKRKGKPESRYFEERLTEEVLYGADFLIRMQDDAGYFYITLFDQWSKENEKRMVCAFSGQEGKRSDDYQAGYRQGGGMAIAALARAGGLGIDGEYTSRKYIEAAEKGFIHLEKHNKEYLDNGKENIIDDYCALLASSELFKITGKGIYRQSSEKRALSLVNRLSSDEQYNNWWRADDVGEIPFFHASDAGMPLVSLLRFLFLFQESELAEKVKETIRKSMEFELGITSEVTNPFGYARQYAKPLGDDKKSSFFIPHKNWSGYWWQGENARIASLASAAIWSAELFKNEADFFNSLVRYGMDQLNWILGKNPYDTCMLQGFGHNNPEYEKSFPNFPGGIVNGITSGFRDEDDIDFMPIEVAEDGKHRWRWSEQWLPHAAWYFLAVCLL